MRILLIATLKARVLLWFGFLAVFAASAVVNSRHNLLWWPFVAWTILIAVLGFHFWKKMSWALVDEVLDGGDLLLVRKLIVRVDRARRRDD